MSSMGKTMAPAVPITVTATATGFVFRNLLMLPALTPAEKASRNVVVTVEKMIMTRPRIPTPALTMILAMSSVPAKIAAPIPITNIQVLTRP